MSEELKACPFCGGEARLVNCGSPMVVCLHGCCQIVNSEIASELWNHRPIEDTLREENKKLKEALDSFDEYHPRAVKLLRKRKNFLVVAEDEPYFGAVYTIIRDNEKAKNTWTNEDEFKYQKCFVEALK